MTESTDPNHEPDFSKLIEEYKICREDASQLETRIWKAFTILGLSSATGLVVNILSMVKLSPQEQFYMTSAIAVLIVTTFIVWWRISRRWWSLQHIKYQRMDELELDLYFTQNSSIKSADDKAMSNIKYSQINERDIFLYLKSRIFYFISPEIEPKISANKNHEHRGNQPVLRLFVFINILFWIVMVLTKATQGMLLVTICLILVYFLVVLLFWRKP